jgi:transglutaminase-like putative cysteine protease
VIWGIFSRLFRWVVRKVGGRNLLLVGLLLFAVGSVALGTADRVRGVDPRLALVMAALGAFMGWTVSSAPWPAWLAILVTASAGLETVFLRVGRLGDELLALSWAWSGLFRTILRWPTSRFALEWRPLWQALIMLAQGGATLLSRVYTWAASLVRGQPVFDPVAVAFVWSLGLWAVSAWAGWLSCRRERPLWALTPGGVLAMVAFSHVSGSHIFLLGLMLAGFLLLAMVSYDRRTRCWTAKGVDYPELRAETAAAAVFLSLALVATAQSVPSLPVRRMLDLAREIGRDRSEKTGEVAESFGMERREKTVFDEVQSGGLPRRHLLGAGPELSEKVVMIISTGDLPPGPPGATGTEPPRYYWRSHTYDIYTSSGWRTGETAAIEYRAGAPAITETLVTGRTVRQAVRMVGGAGGLLHTAGTLLAADHNYTIAWRSHKDAFGATTNAKAYRADSTIPVADEKGLRAQGSDYPARVRDRYLALPDTVPPRVLALALDLTATASTPYDRALAVEAYLRGFPYTLDVSTPPRDRDVVDTFLFDLEKGYCDYYASAMVVLARAAGLPARLAVGYASGTYDWSEGRYVVTEADAHAWPEVYFPNYGWVKFEPTAGRAPVEHSAEATPSGWSTYEEPLGPARSAWGGLRWWQGLVGGLALLGVAAAVWLALERWRSYRQQPLAALASIYRRLRRYGRRLAVPMCPGDTPGEFGVCLAGSLEGFAGEGLLHELVAAGAKELHWLTELYVRSMYSPRSADPGDQARAIRLWERLRWRLRLAQLWQRVRAGE